jgi:ParB/RepB/Spo0J family partition protein
MPETRIVNQVSSIPIEKLVAHPDNPNRMSRGNYAKLVRNIERTGRYEPLVVRPCRQRGDFFQIINGHHRCRALAELGYETAEVIVWDLDDHEADVLIATVNRLGGRDVLDKKLAVLGRLDRQMNSRELAKLLPLSRTQIERLTRISTQDLSPVKPARVEFAAPLVFFVSGEQKKIIEDALSVLRERSDAKTRAEKNAAALASIAECFNLKSKNEGCDDEDQVRSVGK